MMSLRIVLLTALSIFLVSTPVMAQDFGDAPDGGPTGYPNPLFPQVGTFPTLAASGGANATDLTQVTLGPTASAEADAQVTNNDDDDGIVDFVIVMTSIPPPAGMAVNVQAPPTSAGGTYFINVLIDLNMNGEWDGLIAPGISEWVVRNFPVAVTPGMDEDITLPPFPFANGNRLPDGAWMRIALTQEFITDPEWDGSGQFAAGEIEDHVIQLPPGKACVAAMDCGAQRKVMPAGGLAFACTITNVGSDPCTMNHMMWEVTPGADVTSTAPMAPCAANGPNNINCGPTAAIAPGASIAPTYMATRDGAGLPSRWTYRAQAIDPPAIIVPGGVIAGFTDATGDIDFIGEEEKYRKEPPPKGEPKDQPKKEIK